MKFISLFILLATEEPNSLIYFQIFVPLFAVIIGAVLAFIFNRKLKKMEIEGQQKTIELKAKYDKEAEDREQKNSESNNRLMEFIRKRMNELELAIEDNRKETKAAIESLQADFNKHECEGNFRDEFESDIISAHNTIITGNDTAVPTVFKEIMSFWSDMMSSFGLKYSRSNERKQKGIKLKIYLNGKKKELKSALNYFIDSKNIYNKDDKGKRIKFSEWLEVKKIHSCTDELFKKLFINGLDTEELKEAFTNYLIEFDTDFLNAFTDFKELKDYSLMTYERKALGEEE